MPEPMSVTPTLLPFQSAGEVTPELLPHISRSPGRPGLSWTTSTTFLPLAWKSMACTYQAPAMSTCPETIAVSAPTPPLCSVESCMLTPYFL